MDIIRFFRSKSSRNAFSTFFLFIMTALAAIMAFGTLKKSNNVKLIIIGIITCVIVFYLKDLSLALGKTNRISLVLASWMPILIIGVFSSIGILQVNENKFLIIFVLTFCQITNLLAESLNITSKNISVDKKSEVTIFENEVLIKDTKNNTIQSEYAEYNKKLNLITLKKNVLAKDSKGNIFESDDAEYNEKLKVFRSIGETKITTKEGSTVNTKNITLNNLQNIVYSNDDTIITDIQKNKILLNNFEYKANEGILSLLGK